MKLSIYVYVCVCGKMKGYSEEYKQEGVSYSVSVCKNETGLHLVDIFNIALSKSMTGFSQKCHFLFNM